jgi:hypothetical protein
MGMVGPFSLASGYTGGYTFNTVPVGFATDLQNGRIFYGSMIPRWGQQIVNASTLGAGKYVTGLTKWVDLPNSKVILAAVCNGSFFVGDFTSYTDFGSPTVAFNNQTGSVTLSAGGNVRYVFDTLNGILIGVGNSAAGGVPFSLTAYNANIANLAGSPPSGDSVKQVNNFLFIGNQPANPSQVSWSNFSDPTVWPAGNNLQFRKGDGESITALGSIGNTLYIFKPHSIGQLSTTTQFISGTVTLGPLTVLMTGIGCCGPLAIDNLPNGNLVFLGVDNHLYEFDGSSVIDLSKGPMGSFDVYDAGDTTYSLNNGFPNALTIVRVFKGLNEIYVAYDSDDTDGTISAWTFDYLNNIWNGYIRASLNALHIKSSTTMPILGLGGFENSSEYLFCGNENGNIVQQNFSVKRYPTDSMGNPASAVFSTSIRCGNAPLDFIPRSVIFECGQLSADATVDFFYTWDAPFNGGVAVWQSTGASFQRAIVPIVIPQDANGSIPSVLSLTWIMIGSNANAVLCGQIGSFWLSDEFER